MADPNRDPDAVRRDRTDPIPGRRMSENDSDLDSGPDDDALQGDEQMPMEEEEER